MKEFAKRTVTSALVAAMMLSCVSPVFAEGSKEFNATPDSTTTSETSAHRPYFEWRDRTQFGEAGKNVFYVYAQEGETIFFGSDVTTASDRSIEAIVHPEAGFTNTISSSGKTWAGASIAVTLPVSDTEAFDPEKENWYNKTEIESLFLDGSKLQEDCSNEKVYLFKPTPSGKGHILTPSQESKGPNIGNTTDGYEPLSFVAPVTGTYSFRFLAKEYNSIDQKNNDFTLSKRIEYAGAIGNNTVLSPVPEEYTWDFNDMRRGATYKSNTIVGYYSSTNNTDYDYDYNYYYDIEARVSNNNTQITTSDGSLSLPYLSTTTVSDSTSGVLKLLPAWNGKVSVTFTKASTQDNYKAKVYITQSNGNSANSDATTGKKTLTIDVVANKPVYIYNYFKNNNNNNNQGSKANITSITYTDTSTPTGGNTGQRKIDEQWAFSLPSLVAAWDITVAETVDGRNGTTYTAQQGRVWTDRLVLNAGNFQTSIYPQPKVLTKDGFLYAVNLNGIQPWAFSFYSNNRGLLLDRWSLYSKPQLVYGENATPSTDALQALEHSFFSKPTGDSGDIGPAPTRKEVDGDGGQIIYNGNQMESTILANHIPVDPEKDETHKLFFNEPDSVALKAYTEEGKLREITNTNIEYGNLLSNIKYTGLGNFADNESSDIHYGTIGIGGEFEVTISAEEAEDLKSLGSSSISILLDFSGYKLAYDKNQVPVPVLTGDKEWQKITGTPTEDEKNNLVSLSTVIDNDATETKTYKLSWNGRDAYGNIVPKGEYVQVIKSFVEMGMAHFPLLDVEHNPNGIKIKMLNTIDGHDKVDYVYYNNEAVSPRVNPEDPSAWYYSGDLNIPYPSKIGDGLNRTGGISTNFDNPREKGVMSFGHYSDEDRGADGSAGLGYGNSTILDIWSKYEINADAELKIGVKPIKPKHSYVSFVATTGRANIEGTPFDVSHVEFAGNREWTKPSNRGKVDTYGNTISTGFITDVSTTAEGIANNRLVWEITVPVSGKINDDDASTHDTYIKIPTDDLDEEATFTSQEDADEAEYLSYELFSSLFEDFENDEEINIGEEAMPDWEVDADFSSDEEPGIMDIPGNTEYEEIALSEEMYYEVMDLEAVEAGDYKDKDWDVTINAVPEAVLEDDNGVQVNKGDIHKINGFKIDDSSTTDYVTFKVAHKLPTTITGGSTVTVGLVIDNLYAPAATATAKYSSSGWDSLHEITSILFGGSNTYSVQASSSEEYSTSTRNEYNIDGYEDVDILKLGLLMHITFDENGANSNSSSFEATYGGTVKKNGSVTYTSSGKNGKAANFTYGEQNYLELPNGLFNGATDASISFWMKHTDNSRHGWPFMTTPVTSGQVYLSEQYLGIQLEHNLDRIAAECYYNNGSRPGRAEKDGLKLLNNWRYITINFESNSTTIYVDGKEVASQPSSVDLSKLFTANAKTWLGHANWGNGEGFAGLIDDFRIYNRPLSESEIQTLMNTN